jgi:hypothetical protein
MQYWESMLKNDAILGIDTKKRCNIGIDVKKRCNTPGDKRIHGIPTPVSFRVGRGSARSQSARSQKSMQNGKIGVRVIMMQHR